MLQILSAASEHAKLGFNWKLEPNALAALTFSALSFAQNHSSHQVELNSSQWLSLFRVERTNVTNCHSL